MCDLIAALQHVELIIKTFKEMRTTVDLQFTAIFRTAQALLETVDEEIKISRIASRQRHRANVDAQDLETYFRITIIIPILDDFINQLQSRFKNHKSTLTFLYTLIPSVCSKNKYNFKED